MNDSRSEVLARIRRALGPAPAVPEVPRDYRGADKAGPPSVELFCERVADYRAIVTRVRAGDETEALAAACARRGVDRLARAAGLALELPGVELVPDDPPLPVGELDAVDGALTGCAVAIAETGTIVLDGSSACGRRALTLIPDYHLCLVRADQIVPGVPDAIAALGAGADEGRPITMISGPSATSDIELERVEGVHGPRTLDVVVVG